MYELLGILLALIQGSRTYKASDGNVYSHKETRFEYALRKGRKTKQRKERKNSARNASQMSPEETTKLIRQIDALADPEAALRKQRLEKAELERQRQEIRIAHKNAVRARNLEIAMARLQERKHLRKSSKTNESFPIIGK